MESFGAARKRGRPDAANGNGGFAGSKRAKEMDAQSGLGSKSKPCTKFFRLLWFNHVNKLFKQCKLVIHESSQGLTRPWLSEILKHSTQEGSC